MIIADKNDIFLYFLNIFAYIAIVMKLREQDLPGLPGDLVGMQCE
jgi:hypothetical protein